MKAHRAISIQDIQDEIQLALDRGDTPRAMKLGRALRELQRGGRGAVQHAERMRRDAWAGEAGKYTRTVRG